MVTRTGSCPLKASTPESRRPSFTSPLEYPKSRYFWQGAQARAHRQSFWTAFKLEMDERIGTVSMLRAPSLARE